MSLKHNKQARLRSFGLNQAMDIPRQVENYANIKGRLADTQTRQGDP